jgi:hypothetical protein
LLGYQRLRCLVIAPTAEAELAGIVREANVLDAEAEMYAYGYDAYIQWNAHPDLVVFIAPVRR